MNRSGYSDEADFDNWQLIKWRGMVASSTRGRRGQAFLKDLLCALDAMPNKRLIAEELRAEGEVCAIGSLGAARGVDLESIDPYDYDKLSSVFDIAAPLVQEIEYMNDEGFYVKSPEERWIKMRAWVASQIKPETTTP